MTQPSTDTTIGKLLETYQRELETGPRPDREALLLRYPELADELAPALDGLDFIHDAARNLKNKANEADVTMGETLGDYRMIREIGRGGMAIVYEAEQVSLGRRVALKVLPFASVLDPKQRQRFKNEALAAAQLRHPHIVPVYAVGYERGVHYYAMQYVEGGSLAALIRDMKAGTPSSFGSNRQPRYMLMAAEIGAQAAQALDYAHQLGIVHRDVKPGNLLLGEDGTLWVADFGLARSLKDVGLTLSGELLGTVRYMSPEQALAKRAAVDHRTDVYSLGATLYELLTLEAAFPGEDLRVVLEEVVSKEPIRPRRLNPTVPVDLETVVLKAMAKDPAARYATAQELAEDLERFLLNQPILARRPSLIERTGRWTRRHRGAVAAALMILFVGVAALAAGAKREEHNTRIALDKASAALAKAESNLDLAQRAVSEFLTQFGTSIYEDQPTCTPQLAAAFEHALQFYKLYLAERSDPYAYVDTSYMLSALGRHQEAVDAATMALRIQPDLVLAHFARGTAYRLLKKYDEALLDLRHALKLDPSRAETQMQLGVVLRDKGEFAAAYKEWEGALRLDPKLPKALNNMGTELIRVGKHKEALASFEKAVDIAPNFALAHLNMSIALALLGEFPRALVACDRAIALLPESADAHMNRGAVLHALGRREEAMVAVDAALKWNPKLGRAHYNKSVYLQEKGAVDEALAELELSIEYEPDYAPAHGNKGLLLFNKAKLRAALVEFDEAIRIDKNFAPPYCGKGQTLAALDDNEGALAAYTAALEADEKCLPALVNRAGILNRLKKYDEALRAINAAIEVKKDEPLSHHFKCISLYHLRRYPDALAAINEAINYADKDGELYHKRGVCYEAMENGKEALAAYDKAIDFGYRTADLLNQVAWLRAVSPDEALRNASRAVELARQGVRLAPDDPRLRNTLGVALCRAGKFQDALETLKKSIDLSDGGNPFDWFFVAIARWNLGEKDEARRWYDKAVADMEGKPEDAELKRFREEAAALLEVTVGAASKPADE